MKCSILSCFPSSDLPKAALRILSNMTFLFVSLSYTAECAIVTAFITFIPKFIESQFGIPASNASIYTGKCFCGQYLLINFFFLYSFIVSQYVDISLCCLVSLSSVGCLRGCVGACNEQFLFFFLQYVLSNKTKSNFALTTMQ